MEKSRRSSERRLFPFPSSRLRRAASRARSGPAQEPVPTHMPRRTGAVPPTPRWRSRSPSARWARAWFPSSSLVRTEVGSCTPAPTARTGRRRRRGPLRPTPTKALPVPGRPPKLSPCDTIAYGNEEAGPRGPAVALRHRTDRSPVSHRHAQDAAFLAMNTSPRSSDRSTETSQPR
jgi:hypothetical protein